MDNKLNLVCTQCKVEKLTEDFNKNKLTKTGFVSHCKDCKKNHREENKEQKAEYDKKYHEENKERKCEISKRWFKENKERSSEINKKWYQENKERSAKTSKKWYQENKERMDETSKKWGKENPHKLRAASSKRRASKVQATPTWTSQSQKLQIDSLYKQAVTLELTTGIPHHVDHFHPLNSKYICGLHLPINLQPLTESENCSKSNKFQPYVESELDPENLKQWECFYPVCL